MRCPRRLRIAFATAFAVACLGRVPAAGHGGGGHGGGGHGGGGHGGTVAGGYAPAPGGHHGTAVFGNGRAGFAYNPRESQRQYMNHVAGYDHVPGYNGGNRMQVVSPYRAYLDHVAGYDHVYHRR
jgi:hypothetical protein